MYTKAAALTYALFPPQGLQSFRIFFVQLECTVPGQVFVHTDSSIEHSTGILDS